MNAPLLPNLEAAIANINKQYGPGAVMSLGEEPATKVDYWFTGLPALNKALGGGWPRGRIVELLGRHEKTACAAMDYVLFRSLRSVQVDGGTVAVIDMAHTFDVKQALAAGVDVSRVLISQPDCGEQALEIAESLARSGAVDFIVINSVEALMPRAELDGERGSANEGAHARMMSQALRKLTGIVHRTGACFVFVNLITRRQDGSPEPAGTNALKFYASMRVELRPTEDGAIARVLKNKCAVPFKEATIQMGRRTAMREEVLAKGFVETA